ncbi:hypothetical protein [Mucilaginibacter sp.]
MIRYILTGVVLCLIAAGCHKTTGGDGDMPATQSFEPTKQYDVRFRADAQKVVVDRYKDYQTNQVLDSVLLMTYYERITLIVRSDDYAQAWGIRFNESFKGTALDGVLMSTYNKEGMQVYDYLESNLNNLTLQSKTDTVINGSNYTNLKINRVLYFYQYYLGGKTAADQALNALLKRRDVITHSAYFTYNDQNSVPVTGTTDIVYTKP